MILCTPPDSFGQDTYYVNHGKDNPPVRDNAEFAKDLGGFISLEDYKTNNYRNASWSGPGLFWEEVLANIADLATLDQNIIANLNQTESIWNPPIVPAVIERWDYDSDTWWDSNPLYVKVRRVLINGAHVEIVYKNVSRAKEPFHICLFNEAKHFSYFGDNESSFTPQDESPFKETWGGPAAGWPQRSSGQYNLVLGEQVVERGDILVTTMENTSADVWISLQRNQDAEQWVRRVLIPREFSQEEAANLEYSYVYGGSWGSIVSSILGFLQPKVYAGAAGDMICNLDTPYHMIMGDYRLLQSHYMTSITGLPQRIHSNNPVKDLFLLVDLLGIRFDAPNPDMAGRNWDLSFMSHHHRPTDMKNPIQGLWGAEDPGQNWHWQSADSTINANAQQQYYFFTEHGGIYGVREGVNEYFPYKGGA